MVTASSAAKARRAAGADSAEHQLISLLNELSRDATIARLREAWRRRFQDAPPPVQSGDLLLRLFAWRAQSELFGGLDEKTAHRLNLLSMAMKTGTTSSIASVAALERGTILVRNWREVEHRVLVLGDGFEYQGQRYESLSAIARVITGGRWSGPRFFGVEDKSKPSDGGQA